MKVRSVLIAAWMVRAVGSMSGLAAQTPADLAAMGRIIAGSLDSLNGFPTNALDWFGNGATASAWSRDQQLEMTSAFADELGIPLLAGSDVTTRCTWRTPPGDTPLGLLAQFSHLEIEGDSAEVFLVTRCSADYRRGPLLFEQGHGFWLSRTESGWEVVERRLLSIT